MLKANVQVAACMSCTFVNRNPKSDRNPNQKVGTDFWTVCHQLKIHLNICSIWC